MSVNSSQSSSASTFSSRIRFDLPRANGENRYLALFDFDGTLTRRDSMFLFIRHAVSLLRLLTGLTVLSPTLVANRLGLVANQTAKEVLLAWFFKGWQADQFTAVANAFSANHLDAHIKNDARLCLQAHLDAGHDVFVVSASMQDWLQPWCQQQNVQLIASRLQNQDGVLTGKLEGNNCTGAEKVARINQQLELKAYQAIFAYGDSAGDKDMLAMADFAHYRVFKD